MRLASNLDTGRYRKRTEAEVYLFVGRGRGGGRGGGRGDSPWPELSSSRLRFSSVNSVPPFSDWGDESYLRGGFCTGFTPVSKVFCCSGSISMIIRWVTLPLPVVVLLAAFFVTKCSPRRQHTKHMNNVNINAHPTPATKDKI